MSSTAGTGLTSHPSRALLNSESSEPDGKPVYDTFGGLAGVRYPDASARDHTTVLQEIRLLGQNSAPLIVTYLLQFVFIFTTTSLAGHLGTDELAAVALALMTANITGSAVYQGLITGLDTLCAQAYGAGRLDLVGLHVQRMACLLLLVTIPIGTVWMFSPQLLGIIVPQENLAHMAGHALRVLLLGAPGYALFEAGRRFVQAQGLFYGPLLVMLVAVPLNLFGNWLLVFQLGWGFTGAALALSVTRDALPLLLLAYVIMIKPSSLGCWVGFGKATFKDWGPMVKLSLPGIWMVVAEWFAFEILTMAASYLSATELAAQSIILTVCLVMAHITFSISIAVSLRIGNLIGSHRLYSAKVATRAYCIAAVAVGLINGSFILLLRQPIVELFTEDEAVIRIASRTVPVLAILQFFDSSTAVVNGLLKGLGRQGAGAWINLIVYYLVSFRTSSNWLPPLISS